MKQLGSLYLMSTIILLLFSCQQDLLVTNDGIDGLDNLSSEILTSVESRSFDTPVEIYENPDGEFVVVPGATSKLHRTKNGITVNFKTQNLMPNNAYTLWWVIFGDAPGPPIIVTYAAGHIAGGSGKANFSSHLSVGEIFNTPLTAEVHLALRTHGPAQPGIIPDQIQTMVIACTSGFPSGPILYPDSEIVGYCANVQVAMHPGN